MNAVVPLKGFTLAPKAKREKMDTILVTVEEAARWQIPGPQRNLKVNDKVRAFSSKLAQDGGVMSSIIHLGKVDGDPALYLVDGQHRREGFFMSGLPEWLVNVCIHEYETMAELALDFITLQTPLNRLKPDDTMRALEFVVPVLRKLREQFPFVGYDQLRRGNSSPIVSMSTLLKCWSGSRQETPATAGSSGTTIEIAHALDSDPARYNELAAFLSVAHAAWGRDAENYRLWGSLNLIICMWLYRRIVLDKDRAGAKRTVVLSLDMFRKCMMQLSADANYVDWLVGRNLGDRDRSPAYSRVKAAFALRLKIEGGTSAKVLLPQPAWASNRGS